ncbi:MAG TPA: RNA-binding S4 domain-containing protein [Sphingomonadales bacterium]|nr:RNA-binding S4 domain-containing protein [Sphingomonadales bacterium]
MTETPKPMRLDQWLFRARLFKSRTLASGHCKSGKIRVDGQIIRKASAHVAIGQVLTFPKADLIRVVKVTGYPTRRGPAAEAAAFYEDLTPAQKRLKTNFVPRPGKRPKGAGRPTKKERRAIERLRNS